MVVSSSQCGENTAFFSSFPLVEHMAKAFCRLILWGFKEKASAVFYGTAFRKRSLGSFFIGKGNGKALL